MSELHVSFYPHYTEQKTLELKYIVSVLDKGYPQSYFSRKHSCENVFKKRAKTKQVPVDHWVLARDQTSFSQEIEQFLEEIRDSWPEEQKSLPAKIKEHRQIIRKANSSR